MSYEALRADVEWVAAPGRRWLYAVLDEGHAIRNPRSRVTLACKRVSAQHRCVHARARACVWGGGAVDTGPNYTKSNENERSTGRGVNCKRYYQANIN